MTNRKAEAMNEVTKMEPLGQVAPLATQREIDREPAMPTLGNWLGGIALFVGFAAAFVFAGVMG